MPVAIKGDFTDDYGIGYSINDSVWTQHPGIRYQIIRYDSSGAFLVAKNDPANPGEPGLYTRIDITRFQGMEPYEWGFCLTIYNAASADEAARTAAADREHPRTGCNGYPFSRMKRN